VFKNLPVTVNTELRSGSFDLSVMGYIRNSTMTKVYVIYFRFFAKVNHAYYSYCSLKFIFKAHLKKTKRMTDKVKTAACVFVPPSAY
jgi:hypothetical protein